MEAADIYLIQFAEEMLRLCTAVSFLSGEHYFGRNLDLEYSYEESVVITPKNFKICFRNGNSLNNHHAIIGIATIAEGFPLYYDCVNEVGLCIAGLNFPGNAIYKKKSDKLLNIAPFELPLWLLGQFSSVDDALRFLPEINLWNENFSEELQLTPLHWLLSDKTKSVVLEPHADGLKIYENPVGVLTNNPPFEYHMNNLTNYLSLSPTPCCGTIQKNAGIKPDSNGIGSIGLPGDYSSASRFIKASFVKLNSVIEENDDDRISQFFHILESVSQQKGCVQTPNGLERTMYTSCCNADKGIYYYTMYTNHQITAVNLNNEDMDGATLVSYPLIKTQQIHYMNHGRAVL